MFTLDDPADVPVMVLWWINRVVCFETLDHVMVHASVAVDGAGRGVVLAAPQQSGKTTLVAGLVRHGLGYVTDEAAALDPRTGLIDPYPKSLSLEPGSWHLFPELEPDLPPELAPFAARQWHVDPRSIRPDAIHVGPVEPAAVVLPEYRPGAPTTLTPIGRAEALTAMAEESFTLRYLQKEGLDALAGLVRRCRCYRLQHSDLDDGVDAIASLL